MAGDIKPTSDTMAAVYGNRDRNVTPQSGNEVDSGQPSSGGTDSVNLTDRAQQLLKLEEQLAEFPAVDSQRVETIKAAIADGSYKVDAELVAERMLQLETEQKNSER